MKKAPLQPISPQRSYEQAFPLQPRDITKDNGLSKGFHLKGMSPTAAQKTALQLQDSLVDVQATVLSYMDIFLWIGVIFLVCVPFVIIFIKRAKHKADMKHMMQE